VYVIVVSISQLCTFFRAERRQTIVEELQAVYEQEVSFEHWENADPARFLESTGTTYSVQFVASMISHPASALFDATKGVLILDRARKVAYAALSQRCSKRVASQWAKRMGYVYVQTCPFSCFS
jgi:hypothetical protein